MFISEKRSYAIKKQHTVLDIQMYHYIESDVGNIGLFDN